MDKLSMNKISEVLRQKFELNRSYRDIANSLNISLSTVYDYISKAKKAGINWPLPDKITGQELHNKLSLSVGHRTISKILPEWDYINKELHRKGVTLHLLWQEYRKQHPDGVGYSRFCHHYQNYAKTINPIMRQVYKAGEKAFVDYAGMLMEWIDNNGEIFKANIFVGCLGASQLIFAEATAT